MSSPIRRASLPRAASSPAKRNSAAVTEPDSPSKRSKPAAAISEDDEDVFLPPDVPTTPKSKQRKPSASPATPLPHPTLTGPAVDSPLAVSAALSFDYAVAKQHLIDADPRFAKLMAELPCKPFEDDPEDGLEPGTVYPFRSLCTSILGQQVSWLAARSITHKFIRLWFPDLPEKADPANPTKCFPTPEQIFASSFAVLRSAGLSGRKAGTFDTCCFILIEP